MRNLHYDAVFNLLQVKVGVNVTDEPKGNYVVCELGSDYTVYDISGEFFLPNGVQRGQ